MWLLTVCLLAQAQSLTGQAPAPGGSPPGPARALSFGVPLERDVRSGEVHEYSLIMAAGDLVSGTIQLRVVEALVEVVGSGDSVIESAYPAPPNPQRIGFVAPRSGTYRFRIKVFDRFDGGPQWAPGAYVPVVGTASGGYTLRLDNAPVAARMRGIQPVAREQHPSPRLARLTRDLQDGQRDALEAFWREVAGRGPIVQEIPGNDREADVTFLWREIYDTRNVLLLWGPRSEDNYFARLPGTDVWYTTVRVRRGTRVEYDISPNDREEDRLATRQLDPLNPRRAPDDPTYPFFASSVLDMAGAPDEQWALRTPVRRGLIEERKAKSALLKNPLFPDERPIWIYTPPAYSPTAGPYPLLVLLDGAAYVSNRFGNAPATLDNLINEGRIRPAIAVFDMGNRGGGPAGGPAVRASYGEALVKELLPMLRASYPI
ncbi:MAG: enterochelin esterase domain-containing protein, partial [Vicinamibacterales bacterium]